LVQRESGKAPAPVPTRAGYRAGVPRLSRAAHAATAYKTASGGFFWKN